MPGLSQHTSEVWCRRPWEQWDVVPGAGEGECCSLLLPGDGSGTGPGACGLSPCTAGCVLHGSLLSWTVTLTVARCAEHSCSSGSPGKAPSPLERFGAGVCSTVRGCVRLGRVLQAPWHPGGSWAQAVSLQEVLGSPWGAVLGCAHGSVWHRPIPSGCRSSWPWCGTRHGSANPAGGSAPPGWLLSTRSKVSAWTV